MEEDIVEDMDVARLDVEELAMDWNPRELLDMLAATLSVTSVVKMIDETEGGRGGTHRRSASSCGCCSVWTRKAASATASPPKCASTRLALVVLSRLVAPWRYDSTLWRGAECRWWYLAFFDDVHAAAAPVAVAVAAAVSSTPHEVGGWARRAAPALELALSVGRAELAFLVALDLTLDTGGRVSSSPLLFQSASASASPDSRSFPLPSQSPPLPLLLQPLELSRPPRESELDPEEADPEPDPEDDGALGNPLTWLSVLVPLSPDVSPLIESWLLLPSYEPPQAFSLSSLSEMEPSCSSSPSPSS